MAISVVCRCRHEFYTLDDGTGKSRACPVCGHQTILADTKAGPDAPGARPGWFKRLFRRRSQPAPKSGADEADARFIRPDLPTPAEAFASGAVDEGREGVLFPFEAGWTVGHFQEIPGQCSIHEFIRKGDDIENWSELLSIENFPLPQPRVSPKTFLDGIKAVREKKCPGVTKWNVIADDEASILYEWQATPCFGWPEQHEIGRILYGASGVFQLRYTVKVYQMAAKTRTEMIKRLSGAKVGLPPLSGSNQAP